MRWIKRSSPSPTHHSSSRKPPEASRREKEGERKKNSWQSSARVKSSREICSISLEEREAAGFPTGFDHHAQYVRHGNFFPRPTFFFVTKNPLTTLFEAIDRNGNHFLMMEICNQNAINSPSDCAGPMRKLFSLMGLAGTTNPINLDERGRYGRRQQTNQSRTPSKFTCTITTK